MKKQITSSNEYNNIQKLYLYAVKEYLYKEQEKYNLNEDIINEATIDPNKTVVDVSLKNNTFVINSTFCISVSNDIYFDVSIDLSETLKVTINSSMGVENDISTFDIYSKIDSTTNIKMNILLF